MIKINILSLLVLALLLLPNCGPKIDPNFWQQLPKEYECPEAEAVASIKKQTKDMSFKDATIAKEYYNEDGDEEMTIKCAQRMLAVGGDLEIMRQTTLQLAQAYLEKHDYEKAEKMALDYQEFYPGTDDAVLAKYIAIKSNFLASPNPQRDQTKTEKTIELAQGFLDTYKDSHYVDDVKEMIESSYEKLIDKEISIAQTYLDRFGYFKSKGSASSAHKRITYIKEKLLPFSETRKEKLQKRVEGMEIKLAEALESNNLKLATKDEESGTPETNESDSIQIGIISEKDSEKEQDINS